MITPRACGEFFEPLVTVLHQWLWNSDPDRGKKKKKGERGREEEVDDTPRPCRFHICYLGGPTKGGKEKRGPPEMLEPL